MTDPDRRPTPAIIDRRRPRPRRAPGRSHRAPGHGHELTGSPGRATSPSLRRPTSPAGLAFADPGSRRRAPRCPWPSPPSPACRWARRAPARTVRRSRTADVALLLAAFVATAGVAFAIGRWSAAESPSAAPSLAGSQSLAGIAVAGRRAAAGRRGTSRRREPARRRAAPVGRRSNGGPGGRGAKVARCGGPGGRGAHDRRRGHDRREAPAIDGRRRPRRRAPGHGWRRRAPGAMAGFGPGGLQGTVSAIEDGTLTLTTEDGTIVSVATDASTAYVRETPIEAAEVADRRPRQRAGALRRFPRGQGDCHGRRAARRRAGDAAAEPGRLTAVARDWRATPLPSSQWQHGDARAGSDTMRVLVAEDEPGLRDVIVLGLEDAGYRVDAVGTGRRRHRPAALVRVRRGRHRLAHARAVRASRWCAGRAATSDPRPSSC